jgi:two-component system, sensor histidine kinase
MAPHPRDESARIHALHAYAILDTPPDRAYDDIVALASAICGTPIALVSLVDRDRQWFKARLGLEAAQTPREHAFCAHALVNPAEVMVVNDARADARFRDNPLVTGQPHIRFYAGAPLVTPAGHALGTICVIDRTPRELPAPMVEALRALSRQVVAQLELRRALCNADSANRAKSAFLDNMGHEVRTPLNGVMGMLELLGATPLTGEQAEYVAIAQGSAWSLLETLERVLDYSSLEAERVVHGHAEPGLLRERP